MRRLLLLVLLGSIAGACRCAPDAPTPVTLRIRNTSTTPLFVEDTHDELGIAVQRSVGGTFTSFSEELACQCLSCSQICGGCVCDAGTPPPAFRFIPPGESVERTWGGKLEISGLNGCGSITPTACLNEENAPVDEQFQAQLCYSLSADNVQGLDAGVRISGNLGPLTCTGRTFRIEDGVVELTPVRGSACQTHADCADAGTDGGEVPLCFSNTCTSACPANSFPPLGGQWNINVDDPNNDNYGFWTPPTGTSPMVWEATGVVSSATYTTTTMNVALSADAGTVRGRLNISLPPGFLVNLHPAEVVSVKVVDHSADPGLPEARSVVIRDAQGGLLLAADMAQNSRFLGAADTAPFTVTSAEDIVGCEEDPCGRRVFDSTLFTGADLPHTLKPGESVDAVSDAGTFKLLNVTNRRFLGPTPSNSQCAIHVSVPYAIVNQRD